MKEAEEPIRGTQPEKFLSLLKIGDSTSTEVAPNPVGRCRQVHILHCAKYGTHFLHLGNAFLFVTFHPDGYDASRIHGFGSEAFITFFTEGPIPSSYLFVAGGLELSKSIQTFVNKYYKAPGLSHLVVRCPGGVFQYLFDDVFM